jgi:hypothetical protein
MAQYQPVPAPVSARVPAHNYMYPLGDHQKSSNNNNKLGEFCLYIDDLSFFNYLYVVLTVIIFTRDWLGDWLDNNTSTELE